MKIEFSFNQSKVRQLGYTMDAVYQTLNKHFSAKHLGCTVDGCSMYVIDNGQENDYANMWSIIMALLRTDWFIRCADSCIWYDEDGVQEDVLSQAWKVRPRKMA